MPVFVAEMELTREIPSYGGLAGYNKALILLRLYGRPIGTVRVSCRNGTVRPEEVLRAIEADPGLSQRLMGEILKGWLMKHGPSRIKGHTSWSVIVCTRDRVDDLRRCLDSLMGLDTQGGEIIVVDNAPSDDSTGMLAAKYPVRYVREDIPGLNWARSRGAREAKGDIIIYTDDDAVVDRGWVDAMLEPFDNPRVACVTGMAMPLELETTAQELFEVYGGFGRGFTRKAFDFTVIPPTAAGQVGAGVNMAMRKKLVNTLRLFDAEIDCGTVTRSGGDTYAFYRLLAAGYKIVYNPDSIVWHRHRRDRALLRGTLMGYNIGALAFLTRCLFEHGEIRAPIVAASWFKSDHMRQIIRLIRQKPGRLPYDLVFAQLLGFAVGPLTYFASLKKERTKARMVDSILPVKT